MMATNLVESPDRVNDTVRFSAKNQEEAGKTKYNFGAFMDQMDSQEATLPEYDIKTGDTESGAVNIVENDYSNGAIGTQSTTNTKINFKNSVFNRRNKNSSSPGGTEHNGVHQIQSHLGIQKHLQGGSTNVRTQYVD